MALRKIAIGTVALVSTSLIAYLLLRVEVPEEEMRRNIALLMALMALVWAGILVTRIGETDRYTLETVGLVGLVFVSAATALSLGMEWV